jgi:lipid-A-disaccharide synthase-like uncharacterized protein
MLFNRANFNQRNSHLHHISLTKHMVNWNLIGCISTNSFKVKLDLQLFFFKPNVGVILLNNELNFMVNFNLS